MSHTMKVQPFDNMLTWILKEYEENQSIFGIHRSLFYEPCKDSPYAIQDMFGQYLGTPIGAAAGPHTQLTQNIICTWLSGGRFIELKTVQMMDELEISRPCIDMEDEGYNVEWSQELKLDQSANEYIKAWALIHILHRVLGFAEAAPVGTIFNMSVGYNMEGIKSPAMLRFLNRMADATEEIAQIKAILLDQFPDFADIEIPVQITNNVTLSTMHGCPPDEIEQIARYLLEERRLHTTIKLNPTLLGKEQLLGIIHDDLGYRNIEIPEAVFEHDLQYERAVQLIKMLQQIAIEENLTFGIKLTNTLAVKNDKGYLPGGEMYLSGRVLYPIAINLYYKLAQEFNGELSVSYSAGADAFNIADILATGARPITVTSDLLKPGGYSRFAQYLENLEITMLQRGAASLDEFSANKMTNLAQVASESLRNNRYKKSYHPYPLPKVKSELEMFDCITAPCMERCAICQDIPEYAWSIGKGLDDQALDIILARNPLPGITGYICTQFCRIGCTRNNYDEPVSIRGLKRFAVEKGQAKVQVKDKTGKKVAVIGGCPTGLAAAFFLAVNGVEVTIFESKDKADCIRGIAPAVLIPQNVVQEDIDRIRAMGVNIKFSHPMNNSPEEFLQEGFDDFYVACSFPSETKPAILIQACADGRRAAEVICEKFGINCKQLSYPRNVLSSEDILEVKKIRARKEMRQKPQMLSSTEETGGRLAEQTFTEAAARREATRCMQCSAVCDKCVEVCPNRANYTYVIAPVNHILPTIAYQNGRLVIVGEEIFKVDQTRQTVHLDDFCNECGNCASFCVHHGKPYLDKPRLFLKERDFKLEDNNAFYIGGNTIYRRDEGVESKLKITKEGFVFKNSLVAISLSNDFKIKEMTIRGGFGGTLSLRKAAEMSVIFNGVTTSLPFLV